MRSVLFAFVSAVFAFAPGFAADGAPPKDTAPWVTAEDALKSAVMDVRKGGYQALRPHVGELEEAFAAADKAFVVPAKGDVVVLADGPADALLAIALAQKAYPGRAVTAVADPYPAIALYLGSYYNEIRKPEEALRVFDRERALEPNSMSSMRPALVSERAIAYGALRRLPEALAAYDDGLKLAGLSDKDKARMLRGRGFVLTDMERLDEAEAAYNESLKFEPDNALAKREIDYIRRLHLGGNKAPSGILAPDGKPVKK